MVGGPPGDPADRREHRKQDALDGVWRSLWNDHVRIGSKPEDRLKESTETREIPNCVAIREPFGQEFTPLPGRGHFTPEPCRLLLRVREMWCLRWDCNILTVVETGVDSVELHYERSLVNDDRSLVAGWK